MNIPQLQKGLLTSQNPLVNLANLISSKTLLTRIPWMGGGDIQSRSTSEAPLFAEDSSVLSYKSRSTNFNRSCVWIATTVQREKDKKALLINTLTIPFVNFFQASNRTMVIYHVEMSTCSPTATGTTTLHMGSKWIFCKRAYSWNWLLYLTMKKVCDWQPGVTKKNRFSEQSMSDTFILVNKKFASLVQTKQTEMFSFRSVIVFTHVISNLRW